MRPESFRPPLTLEGRFLTLVPLRREHVEALRAASADPEVGRYLLNPPGTSFDRMETVVEALLDLERQGTDLPFVQRRVPDGTVVGMTRYLRIDRPNDAVEIGGTFLDRRCWRTPFNTESKYLLLRHAFEGEGAYRVALQTDLRNVRSQRAIERLGAVREAVLREDRLLPDGSYRNSVYYSILADEWPAVRGSLEAKLARPWAAEG